VTAATVEPTLRRPLRRQEGHPPRVVTRWTVSAGGEPPQQIGEPCEDAAADKHHEDSLE
jgi:hypothetical protein